MDGNQHNKRILEWDGCSNVREFGGLKTEAGREIRWGALVRSDDPAKLSPQGWEALYDHGIRTIISLRTDGMEEEDLLLPEKLDGILWTAVAIEDLSDEEFLKKWAATDLWSTPLYYRDALARWPERHANVFKAIADAKEGGVLFHCSRGVDRTGIISLMLLSLLGVPDEQIAADYMLSADPERDKILKERNTSSREVILAAVKDLDMESYLLGAGAAQAEIEKIKNRLLG
jgi:protein-tyrosine phosphatase